MTNPHNPEDIDPSNKITIERVDNGLVVDNCGTKHVFECEGDFGEDRMVGVRNALYTILESLGYYGSKHDKERVEVRIVHGENFDCTEPDCDICTEKEL